MNRFRSFLAWLAICAALAVPAAHAATTATTLVLLNNWTVAPGFSAIPTVSIESGVVRFSGAVTQTSGSTAVLFTLPQSFRPANDAYVPVGLVNGTKGRLWVQKNGTVMVQAAGGLSANAQSLTSLDGAFFVPKPGGFANLALVNGWTASPFLTGVPAAKNVGGVVTFRGGLASGTNPVAFTLPAALRPEGQVNLPIDICSARKGRLQIETTGVASITADQDIGGDPSCFTSLEGVSFLLKAAGFKITPINGWSEGPTGTRKLYVKQISDVVHLSGSITTGGTNMVAFNAGYHPFSDLYVPIDLCHGGQATLKVDRGGVATVVPDNGATGISDAQCQTSLEGVTFRLHGLIAMALQNGWTGGPFGTNLVSALLTHNKSDADVDGSITLRGAVAGGTTTTIMTVPTSLRPAYDTAVAVDVCGGRRGLLHIAHSGVVTIETANFADAQCFISLDGVTWTPTYGRSVVFNSSQNGWNDGNNIFGQAVAGKAPSGIVHLQASVYGGTAPLITPYFGPTVYGNFTPSGGDAIVPVALCGGKRGQIRVHATGSGDADLSVEAEDNDFASASCRTYLEGAVYYPAVTKKLTLKNGWVGGASGGRLPAANNVDGIVYFQGTMSGGTGVPFVLPAAVRPLKTVYVPIAICGAKKGRMQIATTGNVTLSAEDGDASKLTCFTSLDGASFIQ